MTKKIDLNYLVETERGIYFDGSVFGTSEPRSASFLPWWEAKAVCDKFRKIEWLVGSRRDNKFPRILHAHLELGSVFDSVKD